MIKILNVIIFVIVVTLFNYNSNAIAEEKPDCSQYSTKTFSGLTQYKRCKSGLKPTEKKNWKKTKAFDTNKPCNEYSTKTFTGLAAKMKCKIAKKN